MSLGLLTRAWSGWRRVIGIGEQGVVWVGIADQGVVWAAPWLRDC